MALVQYRHILDISNMFGWGWNNFTFYQDKSNKYQILIPNINNFLLPFFPFGITLQLLQIFILISILILQRNLWTVSLYFT